MTLRQITRDIIARVEQVSGLPVQVLQDASLPTLAAVQIARGNTTAHIVTYKPAAGEAPDYLIAYQCSFILRLFANPPEQRFDFVGTKQGRDQMQQLVLEGPARRIGLNVAQAAQVQKHLLDGLLTHLRSVPVGLRVSEWLRNEYPEFHHLQRTQALAELEQNHEALRREFREMTPEKVRRATLAINAAFALFWAQTFGEPDLAAGYQTGRNEKDGQTLLSLFKDTPSEPTFDRAVIDAWASQLELTGWYDWIPYQPPNQVAQ